MQKLRQNWVPLAAGTGLLCVLLIGGTIFVVTRTSQVGLQTNGEQSQTRLQKPNSTIFSLVLLSAEQRLGQLQAIAQSYPSLKRNRARFLLASDLIQQDRGAEALRWLAGLEQAYPALAPYVVLRQAQAYETAGNRSEALAAWQNLLKRYPKQAVAAEALFVLGQKQPSYWQQAIAQFPSYPRTQEIIHYLLRQNPHQPKLLLLLAKYAYDQPGILSVLDQLAKQSAAQLKPLDWEVIGLAYWENQVYAKAATAYARASHTPLNLYRTARGLQLEKKRPEAIAAYQRLGQRFPHAKETGMGLMHLAEISPPKDAVGYLDRVINQFPHQAGAALVAKAKILDANSNHKAAAEVIQLLLTRYGDSDTAAEYRWKTARTKAASGDYRGAYLWAQSILQRNPNCICAPRAGFWLGKWASQLGRQQDARANFEYVLKQFPQSYYAWRSAVALGLDVGKFTTVSQLAPQVVVPTERSMPPAGSEALKELYQLGQDRDAWALWQVEFSDKQQPTVAQQFTNGVMRLMVGENRIGISQVATLDERETPDEQAQYRALRQTPAYWYALYPLPFFQEIQTQSQQHQLNPLLVTALVRQESGFDPNIRSFAGAIGLMQLMPSTAKWVAGKVALQHYNLENPNDNIQLGTWFLNYTDGKYNNNSLLAVASYNAGTENVTKWLKEFGKGDPDEFVEAIPFDETKNYVRQVFGNYWNYLRLYNPQISQVVKAGR